MYSVKNITPNMSVQGLRVGRIHVAVDGGNRNMNSPHRNRGLYTFLGTAR